MLLSLSKKSPPAAVRHAGLGGDPVQAPPGRGLRRPNHQVRSRQTQQRVGQPWR